MPSVYWYQKTSGLNSLNSDCSGSLHSPADTGCTPSPPPEISPPSKYTSGNVYWEGLKWIPQESILFPVERIIRDPRHQLSHQVPAENYIHNLISSFPDLTHCSQMVIMLPGVLPGPLQGRNTCFQATLSSRTRHICSRHLYTDLLPSLSPPRQQTLPRLQPAHHLSRQWDTDSL